MQNKVVKKLFVCEFITSGGFKDMHLPEGLVIEGRLMRDALLRDLQAFDYLQLIVTHDQRVGRSQYSAASIEVGADTDIWSLWKSCMMIADFVWLIAPETSGVLYQLTKMAIECDTKIIGCDLEAVRMASNKYETANVLKEANINTIPTYYFDEWKPDVSSGEWVIKPIDGAGCEETLVLKNNELVSNWFEVNADRIKNYIIQPYVQGIPASISVLSYANKTVLLSSNLQHISMADGQLRYLGGEINGASAYWESLTDLANKIKTALPGLQGYYGVDVLLDEQDFDKITVVEINPRLTTSYMGLRDAIGYNPAQIVLDAFINGNLILPKIKKKKINFEITH